MKKNSSILASIAILALVVMSCGLQVSPSNGQQGPQSVGQSPQGPQPGGPQPQNSQPGGSQPGGPQPGDQPQPGQPPTPEQPPQPGQPPTQEQSSQSGCAGAPVIPFFNANSTSITSGQSSTLSWGNITNGKTGPLVGSAKIEPGLGEVGSGASSRQVSPTKTTTYTLTASGCGGTKTKQVTITVGNPSATIIMLQAVKANWDLAVDNIYPASNGHIMVTIKNTGNMTMNASISLTCSGTKTTSTISGSLGPTTQSVSINLKAGTKTDIDTGFSRDPSIVTMYVTCSITPPSGDTNSSNDSKGPVKVK